MTRTYEKSLKKDKKDKEKVISKVGEVAKQKQGGPVTGRGSGGLGDVFVKAVLGEGGGRGLFL